MFVFACSTGTPAADDDDTRVDAAGQIDAEPPPDAPPGAPDANATPDASTTPDATLAPDATSTSDATATSDAAIVAPSDAAVPDALPIPDASTCPTAPCDLFEQCGCAGPLVCDLDSADPLSGNECRAVAVAGNETSTCADFDECGGGLVCVNAGGDASCKPYCRNDSDCDAPRGQCVIQLSSGGTDIPGAVVCSSNCDPTSLIPASCPNTWGCSLFTIDPDGVPASLDEVDIADCAPAGAGGQSAVCAGDSDCAPGFLCLDAGGVTPECLRICDNVGNACTANPLLDCLGFVDPHDINGVEYGVCF